MNPLNASEASQTIWNAKARDLTNALLRRLLGRGTTAQRPNNPTDGTMYYDDTLKQPIWWNTEDGEWKDATGTGV